MKMRDSVHCLVGAFIVAALAGGCAARGQGPAVAEPVAASGPVAINHCPGRFQRARTGGLVGTVFGLLIGGLTGSPVIAGVYKVAGYAAGLVTADKCTERGFVVQRVGPWEADESPFAHPAIAEETLTVSGPRP